MLVAIPQYKKLRKYSPSIQKLAFNSEKKSINTINKQVKF